MKRCTFKLWHASIILAVLAPLTYANEDYDVLNKELGGVELADSSDSSTGGLELTVGTEKDSASFKIGSSTGYGNFSLVFSSPIDKTTKEAAFTDFDALANATSVKFNMQWIGFTDKEDLEGKYGSLTAALDDLCELYSETFKDEKGYSENDCLDINVAVKKLQANGKAPEGISSAASHWAGIIHRPIWAGGLTAEYGTEEFEFFSGNTLETDKVDENPWSIGAYLTRAWPGKAMFTLEYKHAEAFKASKNETRCNTEPDEDNEFLSCVNSAGGNPAENINDSLSIGARIPLPHLNVAISPKITRDLEDDDTLVSIPVYLFQNGKGEFTGGIRADWLESTSETEISLFVGTKFDVF